LERRENNMLVDFYERLNKIETKVDKIKDSVGSQQSRDSNYRGRIAEMNRMLMKKPE
jgi:Mg2+ and Co2+ transporter CorA